MKRRYYKRRRRYKGRSSRFKPWIKASAPAVGYVAAKAAQMVAKKYLNTEEKFKDTTTTASISDTAQSHLLNAVAQGDGGSQRDGDGYKVKKLNGRIAISGNSSAASTKLRLAIVIKKVNNATSSLAWDEVFENTATNSFRLLENSKRYTILWNRFVQLDNSGENKNAFFNVNIPLNLKVRCEPGTTNPQDYGIYYLCLSDQPTNTPSQDSRFRIRYLDN